MALLQIAAVFLAFAYYAQAQGMCEMITEDELLKARGPTSSNLLVQTYTSNFRPSDPAVSLKDFTVVCLTAASKRDTYAFISIVAEQICRGNLCPDDHDGETRLVQYDFECDRDTNTWSTNVLGGTSGVRDDNPTANLDTELRTNCSVCANKDSGSDSVNHCRGT